MEKTNELFCRKMEILRHLLEDIKAMEEVVAPTHYVRSGYPL